MVTKRWKNECDEAGNRLLVSAATLRGVSQTAIATVDSEWKRARAWSLRGGPEEVNRQTNTIQLLAHARGFLESVNVVQLSGSATTFEVWLVDRWQEERYLPNLIWRSSAVQSLTGIYPQYAYDGYGPYYTFAPVTENMIWAYGIMAPYENRADKDNDLNEIYLIVRPNAGADNVYHAKITTVALA